MIRTLQAELVALIKAAAMELFGQAPEKIAFSRPPKIEMGDLACPSALELAKRLGKKPRDVATELQAALAGKHAWVERIEIAGPGYLNFYLDRLKICAALAGRDLPIEQHATRGKVIVEHTNINPNKAAHIGHVRNSVLGDTLARALRALGETVEVQNYIDDTGVQVADVVVGILYKEGKSAADAVAWIKEDPRNLDKRCWDLYAATTKWYEADKTREQFRRDTLHAIEKNEGDAAAVARALVPGILRCHLATMARLGIRYDVLTHESTIIHLGFFQDAFERMKKSGAIHLAAEGKNKDCWVMRLQDDPEFKNLEDPDKVIVRSNGTVTYIGKDIANQMWKLGLLGKDFAYGLFEDFDGNKIYQTREEAEAAVAQKQFGHGAMAINVIDNRQSYLQKIVAEGLRRLGHPEAADHSIHFNYEMVALTPAAAEYLGFTISDEDKKKPFIEMSGRQGLGVKADDLLDELVKTSRAAIASRDPELGAPAVAERAQMISIAAVRYYMIKFNKAQILPFDFAQSLAFEGDTGPYLLYTAVRARNIMRKYGEAAGKDEAAAATEITGWPAETFAGLEPEAASLLMDLLETPKILDAAVTSLELSLLARHFYLLAQGFNNYYHKYPVIKEGVSDADKKRRLKFVQLFERHFKTGLETILGIPVPERM
jgi:arginyl-tRNA synthetase